MQRRIHPRIDYAALHNVGCLSARKKPTPKLSSNVDKNAGLDLGLDNSGTLDSPILHIMDNIMDNPSPMGMDDVATKQTEINMLEHQVPNA